MSYRLSATPELPPAHPPEGGEKVKAAPAHPDPAHPEVAGVSVDAKNKAANVLKGKEGKNNTEKPNGEKHPPQPPEPPGPDGVGKLKSIPDGDKDPSVPRAMGTTALKTAGIAALPVTYFLANGTVMAQTAKGVPFIASAAEGTLGNTPFAAQNAINYVLGVNGADGLPYAGFKAFGYQMYGQHLLSGALLGGAMGGGIGYLLGGKKGAAWGSGIGAAGGTVAGEGLAGLTPAFAPYVLPALLGYGGYKAGKWVGEQTGLHPVLARGAGTVAGVAGGAYFAGNGALFSQTIGLIPQGLAAIGPLGVLGIGALAGYGIGEKWFGNGKLGALVGTGAGGVASLALSGVAASTALSAFALPAAAGGALYGLGRLAQNYFGFEKGGILKTMWDAPRGALTGATNVVSRVGSFFRSLVRGPTKAIDRKPLHGFGEKLTGIPGKIAMAIPNSIASFAYGMGGANHPDFKKTPSYKHGNDVRNVITSPVRGVKKGFNWLLANRGGAAHDDSGGGGAHH